MHVCMLLVCGDFFRFACVCVCVCRGPMILSTFKTTLKLVWGGSITMCVHVCVRACACVCVRVRGVGAGACYF